MTAEVDQEPCGYPLACPDGPDPHVKTTACDRPYPVAAADGRTLLERGRYAITGLADGSRVITRAAPVCETCQACGCGEQADPIMIPSAVVALLNMDPDQRSRLNPLAVMKNLMAARNG